MNLENNSVLIKWLKNYWLLLVLPIAYLLLISPYITGRISTNNHNLIITLTTIENWLEDGALAHSFNLINSWGNPGDLGVHYYPRVMSEEGRNYFVSYPPLSFIVFYGVVNIFQPSNFIVAFKLFGVLIHLFSFCVLFYIIKNKSNLWIAYLLGGVFLFFPSSIVLSLMYYPEQLIILLLLLLVVVFEFSSSKDQYFLLLILSFMLVYCDWLGVLIIGSMLFFNLFISEEKLWKVSLFLVLGGSLGGLLLLFQYSNISGFEALVQGLKVRYIERSGVFSEFYSDRGVNLYSSNTLSYLFSHLVPTIIGGLIAVCFLIVKKGLNFKYRWIWLVIVPILVHMIVLFNSNIIHFQNLAKLSLVFSLGVAFWIGKKTIKPVVVIAILSINIFFSVYFVTQYFDQYSSSSEVYDKADFIRENNDLKASIVLEQEGFSEDLVLLSYLTKRNLTWQKDSTSAFLNKSKYSGKIVFLGWPHRNLVIIPN